MAQLGVSFKDFGVLMTAFKEGGVNANSGCERPKERDRTHSFAWHNKEAIGAFGKMNIDIKKLATDSGGNLFAFLKALAPPMKQVLRPDCSSPRSRLCSEPTSTTV
jgi:hypothetical protein